MSKHTPKKLINESVSIDSISIFDELKHYLDISSPEIEAFATIGWWVRKSDGEIKFDAPADAFADQYEYHPPISDKHVCILEYNRCITDLEVIFDIIMAMHNKFKSVIQYYSNANNNTNSNESTQKDCNHSNALIQARKYLIENISNGQL